MLRSIGATIANLQKPDSFGRLRRRCSSSHILVTRPVLHDGYSQTLGHWRLDGVLATPWFQQYAWLRELLSASQSVLEGMGVDFQAKPSARTGLQVLPIGNTAYEVRRSCFDFVQLSSRS